MWNGLTLQTPGSRMGPFDFSEELQFSFGLGFGIGYEKAGVLMRKITLSMAYHMDSSFEQEEPKTFWKIIRAVRKHQQLLQ
jgi:hypothetical protein